MIQRIGCHLALSLHKIGGASEEKNKQATTSLPACTIFDKIGGASEMLK